MTRPKGTRERRALARDGAGENACYGPALGCTRAECVERLGMIDAHLDDDWRDSQMAEALGIRKNTFAAWRLTHGIPPKPTKVAYHLHDATRDRVLLPREEHERRLAAYHDHPEWTDAQMGREFGITHSAVRSWRKAHGLPPHRRRGERLPGPRLETTEDARRLAAYHELRGRATEAEAAQALGMIQTNFSFWRRSRGLAAVSRPAAPAAVRRQRRTSVADGLAETIRRLEAYLAADSDDEIAKNLGYSAHTIRLWRTRRARLPPRTITIIREEAEAQARAMLDAARAELRRRDLADSQRRLVRALRPNGRSPPQHG